MDLNIPGLEDLVEIGRGGFATVYRAYQPAFRRTVAVKVLNADDVDDLARERFQRECQAMGLLSEHPSIVTVLDAGFLDNGRAYMVMPYMPAGSLADRVRSDGPMPWADASRVAVKLAGALHAAHDAGVIHRDVKPANVLVSEYGETKLADFGIARVAGGTETQSGVVTASLAYAPPEVIEGKRPSVRSDIYSLGATVYGVLAGRPPFDTNGETSVSALLQRILHEDPPNLASQGVPEPLAQVIATAMAKDPEARYDTAAAFGRQIRLVQDELGIKPTELTIVKVEPREPPTPAVEEPPTAGVAATVAPQHETSATPAGLADTEATNDIPVGRPSKTKSGGVRRPWILGGIAALAAVVVVVVILLATGDGGDTVASDTPGEAAVASADQPASAEEPAGASDGETSLDADAASLALPTLGELCPDGLGDDVPEPGANLSNATLSCLDWSGADLRGVDLGDATLLGVDLSGAALDGANLVQARFDAVRFTDASLTDASLSGTNFDRVDFRDVDLSDASLVDDIHLTASIASGVDFTVHTAGAADDIVWYHFVDSDLSAANLTGRNVHSASGSVLVSATLDDAYASVGGMQLPESNLDGASLRGADLSGGPLNGATFVGADLAGTNLAGADLTDADLTDAIVDGADFTEVTWNNTTCPDGTSSNENLGACDS